MQPDVTHEFNLGGEWWPALVETVDDDNNATFLVIGEGGAISRHTGSRGDEQGQFRDKS